ncbi:MAG: heavy metal-binding domain-containing protein [Candidatus Saccharimonadales bacterium]
MGLFSQDEPEQQNEYQQVPNASAAAPNSGTVCSGLSGNEMYCAALLDLRPGNLLVGNSVFSMGILRGIGSNIKVALGGEITGYTDMIAQGRKLSYQRLTSELQQNGAKGVAGVSSEMIFHNHGNEHNVEFLSIGSAVHPINNQTGGQAFTTSADAQELFCQVDAGYRPVSFVFGNVAYSIGIGGNILGGLRKIAKGEVKSYSNIFNETRNLALQRIVQNAQKDGANAVIGIQTSILPFDQGNIQEMVMIGTAAEHQLAGQVLPDGGVITSDLTAEETWNIAKMGYMPQELVLGTSVYSLGAIGGLTSSLKSMVHGEIDSLTQMIYGARENSIGKLQAQASQIGADDVLGIRTYIYDLGGDLIEFLAIGTAVKRVQGTNTHSPQLPPQAIIRDKQTFYNSAEGHRAVNPSRMRGRR